MSQVGRKSYYYGMMIWLVKLTICGETIVVYNIFVLPNHIDRDSRLSRDFERKTITRFRDFFITQPGIFDIIQYHLKVNFTQIWENRQQRKFL